MNKKIIIIIFGTPASRKQREPNVPASRKQRKTIPHLKEEYIVVPNKTHNENDLHRKQSDQLVYNIR